MKRVSDIIASFEKKLAMVLMFAMAVVITVAVIFRALSLPLTGASEIAIFLLVYISFLGGSLGLKYKTQAAVTIGLDYLSDKWKRIVSITAHCLMLLFMAIIVYYSFSWILSPGVAIQRSSALLIPMWIPYAIVPLGLTFATIHILSNLVNIVRGGVSK